MGHNTITAGEEDETLIWHPDDSRNPELSVGRKKSKTARVQTAGTNEQPKKGWGWGKGRPSAPTCKDERIKR